MRNNRFAWLWLCHAMLACLSCQSQRERTQGPTGYDFLHPVIYKMPMALDEISGICFAGDSSGVLHAEQDEDGKVFQFIPGSIEFRETKFGKKGDYEDICICRRQVFLLRSDGVLFSFPLKETLLPETSSTKKWESLVPPGEYEGLYAEESTGRIWVLCKHCSQEKTSREGMGYILQLRDDGSLVNAGTFGFNVRDIEKLTGLKKINFHPSALTKNRFTGEWFILSSVNHLLVVADPDWNILKVYALDPKIFPQPEGIAFDHHRNLYISSERGLTGSGRILKFEYQH